jgi:hypothetical protein
MYWLIIEYLKISSVSENVELTLMKGHIVINIMFYMYGVIQKKGEF